MSAEEYLALEERADFKSEYFDGEIFAMAGGSLEHNVICGNLLRILGNQLEEGPCRVLPGDQRVVLPSLGCPLPLPAVYHKVEFPPPPPGRRRGPR